MRQRAVDLLTRCWLMLAIMLVAGVPGHAASPDPAVWMSGLRQMVMGDTPVGAADQLAALQGLIKQQTVKPPGLVLAASVTA